MNLRLCMNPYTALQIRKAELTIIRVHTGTRILILWLGQSCCAGLMASILSHKAFRKTGMRGKTTARGGNGSRRRYVGVLSSYVIASKQA